MRCLKLLGTSTQTLAQTRKHWIFRRTVGSFFFQNALDRILHFGPRIDSTGTFLDVSLKSDGERSATYYVGGRYAQGRECGSQPEAAIPRLPPCEPHRAIDDGGVIPVNRCRSLQEADWRQWHIIRRRQHGSFHLFPALPSPLHPSVLI